MLFHCWAQMLPNRCAGIGLPSGTRSLPYLLLELAARVAVQAVVERLHLRPQPLGLLLEVRRRLMS